MHSGNIKIIKNLIFFFIVVLLENCYSSVITNTWQAEDSNKKSIKKYWYWLLITIKTDP